MKSLRSAATVAAMALVAGACDQGITASSAEAGLAPEAPALSLSTDTDFGSHSLVLGVAETITDPLSGEPGQVIWLQKDLGNGQLSHDFVYGDPRRASFNGGEPGITYAVNTGFLSSDANLENQVDWLHDSVLTWDGQTCSDLTLSEGFVPAGQLGSVDRFFRGGPLLLPTADITQVGFLGAGAMFPPGTNVLGVTYTLFWQDGAGNLTDIDGNGKIDAAFREIYYNDQYNWADNGIEGRQPDGIRYFDFPAVAIHEVGHAFSAAHFGNIGVKDGFLFPKPQAIMNAIYSGLQRDLTGRDVGLHCSNWAQWPNN